MSLIAQLQQQLLLCCWLLVATGGGEAAAAASDAACPDIFQETVPLLDSVAVVHEQRLQQVPLALLSNLTRPERLRQLAQPLLAGPRPVGSAGHERARAHLAGFLGGLGWRVQHDRFQADTPVGRRRFASIVATRPSASASASTSPKPVLVLAAHYDSAPLPDFVGATDSAVPCAILLLLAEALDDLRLRQPMLESSAAIRLVFFDGEEALGGEWTSEDSLYGSRHLADRWLVEPGVNPGCSAAAEVADLVLLDLIGAPSPRLAYAALPGPGRLVAKERRDFSRLVAMETRLRAAGQLPETAGFAEPLFAGPPPASWRETPLDTVADDHLPLRRLGVPALHLVPALFPPGWHTPADSAASVHWGHSAAVARVLLAWLLEAATGEAPV